MRVTTVRSVTPACKGLIPSGKIAHAANYFLTENNCIFAIFQLLAALPASVADPTNNDKHMTDIEDFIYNYEGSQREIMLYIHNILSFELNLKDKLRFKIPFYYRKSWICYLNPTKNNTIELAFVRGNELSNSQGLLDNKGRKQVYSLELKKITEIPMKELNEIIQEAILLDETIPYSSKRTKNKRIINEK